MHVTIETIKDGKDDNKNRRHEDGVKTHPQQIQARIIIFYF